MQSLQQSSTATSLLHEACHFVPLVQSCAGYSTTQPITRYTTFSSSTCSAFQGCNHMQVLLVTGVRFACFPMIVLRHNTIIMLRHVISIARHE